MPQRDDHRRKKARRLTLGDECEAYCAGRSWELYRVAGFPMPAWVQANRLARGTVEDITRLAAKTPGRPESDNEPSWDYVMYLLGQQLLAADDEPGRFEMVQTSALAPLEEMLLTSDNRCRVTAAEFFRLALHPIVDAERAGNGRL